MSVLLFTKTIREKDGSYNESEWVMSIVKQPPTKELYFNVLKQWANEYFKKNFPQTGFKNFVLLKAGVLKQVIPCKRECPDVDVGKLVANYYSMHSNLPVPDKALLTYVSVERGEDFVQGTVTKYLLKASPHFEVYWERKFYRVKKQVKRVKIQLKNLNIKETLRNKELVNLVYYNLFDINHSKYDDALELLKMTNPDGVVYFEFNLYNNIVDYETPTNNLTASVTEKKFVLNMPDVLLVGK